MPHVITQHCCKDATCVAVCPVDCIHPAPHERGFERAESLYIDPETCIDCGACVDVCPVDAIAADFTLPLAGQGFIELNARYFRSRALEPRPARVRIPAAISTQPGDSGLKVAIVGAGPGAWYAAEEVFLRGGPDAVVHMYERLPTPWGLVRYGVAPDHQDTKNVTRMFQRTARRPGFALYLNVHVGRDVTHDDLRRHYHAVLYAVGAPEDIRLGIPGEDLPGCHSATEFVAWYNGHPEAKDYRFDFAHDRAVVVGNGNVALDIARILLSSSGELAKTDIADHALQALAESRITEVVVLGRRSPAQAAYTVPELLALTHLPGVEVVAAPREGLLDGLTSAALRAEHDPMISMKVEIIRQRAAARPLTGGKRVVLRYLVSPLEVLGDTRVRGVRVGTNVLEPGSTGALVARSAGDSEELGCGLILRSVGSRGAPVPGLPFDVEHGMVPNREGRVLGAANEQLAGVYVVGWIKRGSTGAIGTNKVCAAESVGILLKDRSAGRLPPPACSEADLSALLSARQIRAIDYAGWRRIDRYERSRGVARGRPRVKLVDTQTMLDVAHDVSTAV